MEGQHQITRRVGSFCLPAGSCFSRSLKSDVKDTARSYFTNAENYISTRAREKARINYSLASITLALAIVVGASLNFIFYCESSFDRGSIFCGDIMLASLGGVVGATFSVILRSHSLSIEPFISYLSLRLEGAFRIILGLLSGIVAFAVSEADIAFGFVDGSNQLFVVTLLAGFSERWIPELMGRISTEIKRENKVASTNPGSDRSDTEEAR